MAMNQPKQHVRLPLALAVTAVAVIATVVNFTDKTADGIKGKVVAVLSDADQNSAEPPRDIDNGPTDGNLEKLKTLLEELPQLPHPMNLMKPLDIPTARDLARNGDIEAARFLIKTYDMMQRDMVPSSELPSEKDNTEELENIDEEIFKKLGISRRELDLFRSADELLFHFDLLERAGKLKAMAKELNDSGVRLMSGQDHEGILSVIRYPMIMSLLCRQTGLGPGGANESLFLKLIGKSPQQLQDLAHSAYDYFRQGPVDEGESACLDYIRQTFSLLAAGKKEFDLELRK